MKRFALVLALIALFGGIAGAQTFDELKGALSDIATGGAKTIGVNAAIGNTWSDAFIGSFPHFGAGVFVGATGTGMTTNIKSFMTQMGATLPPQFDALGFPIPALGAMAKIGLPFLPIDVGVKVGMIPPQLQAMIPGNFEVDYRNLGISLRAALVKEKLFLPDISVGASWNRVNGMVRTSVGSAQTFSITLPSTDTYAITAAAPKVGLEWAANTYDFNLQVSKKLLFILTPYVGAGYSMGPGTVKAGVFSSVTGLKNGATAMTQSDFDTLNAYLSANGYPTVSQSEGLVFSGDAAKTLRIYGGFSLNILLALDCQVMYVPDTKQLGASVSARIQL